jgi:hypothetical protein
MAAQRNDVATHYERRRHAVHERILAAALERFEQTGIENTTVDEICALATNARTMRCCTPSAPWVIPG